jgi:hypothetical protein
VPENHWRLQVTRRGLASLSALLPDAAGMADDLDDWLDREDIPDGVSYLISPDLEYDIGLNRKRIRTNGWRYAASVAGISTHLKSYPVLAPEYAVIATPWSRVLSVDLVRKVRDPSGRQ